MPRTANTWKIDGLHPAEYAAQWGSGTRDGMRFYNCSDQCPRTGGVTSNPDWTREDWSAFVQAVKDQGTGVARAIRTAGGRKRTGWTAEDVRNLQRLAEWGNYMAGRAVSTLPWLATTV